MIYDEYISGYLQRRGDGEYVGELRIDGIDLSPITGVYFKRDGVTHLWLKRCKVIEYNMNTNEYVRRDARPRWETYLVKRADGGAVAFYGEFTFFHFKYSIKGVWDEVLGNEKVSRLNLYVERLPINQQTIINNIHNRKNNGKDK